MSKGHRFGYSFIVIALFTLLTNTFHAYPPGWSDDILLPETPGYSHDPDISVDSYNNVWVVWDSNFWGSGYVYYTKRDSLGNCIIPKTMLPDPLHSCGGHTNVVVDNSDNVHIQWTEPGPTGKGIGYAKLDSSGSIVVNPHLAMPGHGGGSSCNRHEIALDKYSNINVVWDESPLETNQISYTKLDSIGDTLISRIRVSPMGLYSIWPGIGVDSFGNIHMAYRTDTTGTSDRLTYSKLDNNGNFLISNKVLGTGMAPTIISDRSQNIHMVYVDPTPPFLSIKYLKLDQEGNFLVTPHTISIPASNNYPHMAMDSLQYLHVVWHLQSQMGIMYTKLDTLGNYVITPMLVVYPPYAVWPGHPRIAVDHSNRLHLVWADQRFGHTDIFYKRGENETGIEEGKSWIVGGVRLTIYPNPFRNTTDVRYEITTDCEIRLLIYDICGRLVKDLSQQQSTAGHRLSVTWYGTDNHGHRLPAGVYLIRIESSSGEQSVPVVLLR